MEVKSLDEIEKTIIEKGLSLEEQAISQMNEIIEALPHYIRNLIQDAFVLRRIPKEYLLSSILFAFSNVSGLAFKLNAMDYDNYANLYWTIIGSRGDVKSPAMALATDPLNHYDNQRYLDHKEKCLQGDSEEEVRNRLFIKNATIEATHLAHYHNPNSLGIYMDEMFYLIEKMTNPNNREGPLWRELLIEGYTNQVVDILRKTTKSFRLLKSYPVLLGSIQNEFIPKIFSGGNLESGLTDRILYTPKLTENKKLSREKMNPELLKLYSANLLRVMEHRTQISGSQGLVDPYRLTCTSEAEDLLYNYTQDLINQSDEVSSLEQAYLKKVQINIHKMTLLLHIVKASATPELRLTVNLETVEEAMRIIEFYRTNFKIIMASLNQKSIKVDKEEVIRIGLKNNATQEQIAAVLGVNKSTVSRKIAKMKS